VPLIVYTYPKDIAKYGSDPLEVSETVATRAILMRRAESYMPPLCTWCGRLKADCPPCDGTTVDCGGACLEPEPAP